MTIEEQGTPAGVAPRACALSVSHLTKCFGDIRAVDDLDLTVGEGELFALLGVNGAGKTTTIRMLTALTAPTSGSATVLGFDLIRQNREVRAVSGVSPQQTAVAGGLTVRENLMMMARIFGCGREEAKARADALIALLDSRDRLGWVGSRIERVQQGYVYTETAAGTLRFVPGWRIDTDTGAFFVSGATREVRAVE